MKRSHRFAGSDDDTQSLIAAHPFAWLASTHAGRLLGTPVPLLLDAEGTDDAQLIGHRARANPQVKALRADPAAPVGFMGASGYVSPSWFGDRSQAATWNHETAQLDMPVHFDEPAEVADDTLARLVTHIEAGREGSASIHEMGHRYERLAGAVIAFRARIINTRARFKLGRNVSFEVYEDILRGLERTATGALGQAMRRANPNRRPRRPRGMPLQRSTAEGARR